MNIYFPKETNKKLYHNLKKYSTGDKKNEVLFPLCLNSKNRVNLGTKRRIGKTSYVNDIPYSEKCCAEGNRIGSIHTHPYEIGADDIDYFKETEYYSQDDLFGSLADHINKETKDNVTCAVEPLEMTKEHEELIVVCKRIKDVTEDDLLNVKRTRKPDFTRESKTTLLYPKIKKESVKLIKEYLKVYPYGENIPESVIMGLKKEIVDEIKERTNESREGGIVYPFPEMQHTTDMDEWLKDYENTLDMSPTERFLKKEKIKFWRKADAASIEEHLKKLGKLSEDRFKIVCKKAPFRKTRKGIDRPNMICNFAEKKLEL